MSVTDLIHLAVIGAQTLIFVFGAYKIIINTAASTKSMGERMRVMEAELKELAKVVTVQAVQTQRLDEQSKRLNRLEQTLEDLRRGSGWITARKSVEGEY